jgi:hypothetical protein
MPKFKPYRNNQFMLFPKSIDDYGKIWGQASQLHIFYFRFIFCKVLKPGSNSSEK